MHELQRVLERQVRELAGGVLCHHRARRSIARRNLTWAFGCAVTNVCPHSSVLSAYRLGG